MPRATWEGQLSFGLITFPVALFSAGKSADLEFNLLDARDQARIRYVRVNEETGEEVPWNQIVRAFEYDSGNYVMLSEEDFERASVEATRRIDIDAFVDKDEIEPYYFEKPYVLVPRKGGEKAYVLLREALAGTGKVGIARVVIRSRQYLLALMPHGSALMAERMRFPGDLRGPEEFGLPEGWLREYGVSARELDAAEKLVQSLSTPWEPDRYHDEYREALLNWIDKKIRTGETIPLPEQEDESEPPVANTEDLLILLEQSLENRGSR
jgi:DNA end-binding protein Ku